MNWNVGTYFSVGVISYPCPKLDAEFDQFLLVDCALCFLNNLHNIMLYILRTR